MNNRFLLATLICASLATSAFADKKEARQESTNDPNTMVAYLFTYFNSNDPKDEQICYAISDDGYNFTPLNHGNPVISSDILECGKIINFFPHSPTIFHFFPQTFQQYV